MPPENATAMVSFHPEGGTQRANAARNSALVITLDICGSKRDYDTTSSIRAKVFV